MRRLLAALWLAAVLVAIANVVWSSLDGLPLQSDLSSLLPTEERDPALAEAKRLVTDRLSRQVLFLVGHSDPGHAIDATEALHRGLLEAGVLESGGDMPDVESVRKLGQLYFPYRQGLLADADRIALSENRAIDLVQRALAQIYGIGGVADARLLVEDPFLTFPAFVADLPFSGGRFTVQKGWPTVRDGATVWVVLNGRVVGNSFSLQDQERFVTAYGGVARGLAPDVQVKRLGAVFFAEAGARKALEESSLIGTISLVGTVVLLLVVFRSAWPLIISVMASAIGIVCALSVCLTAFGKLHAAVTIFGASLTGVTVDYAVHYCTQVFEPSRTKPSDRLAHVMPGISIGLATTLVGYLALTISPLPGLRQAALFAAIGLIASFLTVVLWFPVLDCMKHRKLPEFLRKASLTLWDVWEDPGRRFFRRSACLVILAFGIAGTWSLEFEDDIRRQQTLDASLVREQTDIRRLLGSATANQFFLVRAETSEQALAVEERLADRLAQIKRQGGLEDWRSPARFVPSLERQLANAKLRTEILELPHLAEFRARVGLPSGRSDPPAEQPLRLGQVRDAKALPFIDLLILKDGLHVVALEGASDLDGLRNAAHGLDGVNYVDPAAELSDLLSRYRGRAEGLILVSVTFMAILLCFRYGLRGAAQVLLPPVAAILLTPGVLALAGLPFTFFGAMALMMVLAMGVDFAVFCAEDAGRRDPVTILATSLATLTAVLSFGLMAFSQAAGVRSFGAVMLVGMILAFLLSPFAGRVRPKRRIKSVH